MDIAGRRMALVLGGGGALGAFEAGAYEALHEAGILPEAVAGTSIGAFNAALIAGNPPAERVARLRAFWERLGGWLGGGIVESGEGRRILNAAAATWSRLLGRPGFYSLTLPRLFFNAPGWGQPAVYDFGPALATLEELVDFDLIARGEPRLSLNATDLERGEPVLFDNRERRLTPKHVLASAALIPDFPPQEIDGRAYCDGGFTANVPLHAVFGRPIEADTLCFAVDLFSRRAEPAWSIDGMAERRGDLTFANQTRSTIEALKAKYALLAELRAVAAELSAKRRQALQQAGRLPGDASVALAVLNYSGRNEGIAQKIFDYSQHSISERWAAGRAEAAALLERLREAPEPEPGSLAVVEMEAPRADAAENMERRQPRAAAG